MQTICFAIPQRFSLESTWKYTENRGIRRIYEEPCITVILHGKCQELWCENAMGSNQQRAGVCLEHSIYQSPSVRFLLFPENEQRHWKNATGLQFVLFHMDLHATSSFHPEEQCFWWQPDKEK